ncbi:hypothetical protein PC116_g6079 [Phytophthora cactorum]|uniref:Uncharacterized protein n=1 Tax=Phytophthora cactorum TaxID=29920 RepID=A0A8T1E357_9STRA|nr:hypothetical protein PC114_g3719 [Phytophthora cactorum]KAG2948649.1 hypothetical protein PC117_g5872 [Phytophthora cactorum]KAG3032814.1 hypothetical protein PC120_g2282 [Phytophthora cactorum]KAG3040872.1 hypothetical protein PC119_g1133 [Phytophthora cactorum]KAG3191319.1 hypothetical protein C6341_g1254 [Phytophthora cactorum]
MAKYRSKKRRRRTREPLNFPVAVELEGSAEAAMPSV